MTHVYDDIIHLPRYRSQRHAPMPRIGRAAQFAPFAALTGFDAEVEETARLTQSQIENNEENLMLMDEKLHAILDMIRDQPEVAITYFEPDARKSGGAYVTISGRIRRVDEVNRQIILTDRTVIGMDAIHEIECSLT